MPWTVLRPSFRSWQVEPMTCTSCCALLNLYLCAGCQYLRYQYPWQPLFSLAYPLMNFPTWPRESSIQPMFVKQSALLIFPNEPIDEKICVANFFHCWDECQHQKHYFRQPAKVCTSWIFDIVTNHPHQKNPTPLLEKLEVPLHHICYLSHRCFSLRNL